MGITKKQAVGVMLACLVLGLTACQTTSTKQAPPALTTVAPAITGSPSILGLQDAGSLPLQVGGALSKSVSDGRYSPGEWLLVMGKNLGVKTLQIDGKTVPVDFYWTGSPVVKIPTGLLPLQKHQLVIDNGQGRASTGFHSSHYIVATDTDGKQRHLIRTNPDEEGGVEEEWIALASDAERPLFTLFSPDSAFLYTVNIDSRVEDDDTREANAYVMDVRVFHAAAPNAPEQIKQFSVTVDSSPIDATMGADGTLVILGKHSFTVVDASNPLALVETKRVWLANSGEDKTTYVDVIFFNGGANLAVLETYSNQVFVYDTQGWQRQAVLDLLPAKSIALSVDLEPDPLDPSRFWALVGPNYRLSGSKLVDQYKKWVKRQAIPEDKVSVHQLVQLRYADNQLSELRRHELDRDYAAYFVHADATGDLVITTTKMKFLTEDMNDKSTKEMLKMTKEIVWDALSFGRVVKVNATSGAMETLSSGVGIYYDLELIPGIGHVWSLLKFGPSFSMPFITPNWGIGISSTGTYAKRKMNKYAIFPPYSVGDIAFQR